MTNKEKFNAGQYFTIDRYVIDHLTYQKGQYGVFIRSLTSDRSELMFDSNDINFMIEEQTEEIVTGYNYILDTKVEVSVSFNEMDFDLPINEK